jgi:uncharacterized membrane protein YphA (DoxX/SURF4 family)
MSRYVPHIARILLGTIFVLSGIVMLLHLVPTPPPPEKVLPFMTGMMSTGYFFPLLKATEITCGLLLLSNRFVPLALVVLSPVIVHIAALHLFLDRSGLGIALTMVALQAYLGWAYRSYFRGVLTAKTEPASSSVTHHASRAHAAAE